MDTDYHNSVENLVHNNSNESEIEQLEEPSIEIDYMEALEREFWESLNREEPNDLNFSLQFSFQFEYCK